MALGERHASALGDIPPPAAPENFSGTAGVSRNISLSWTQPESETEATQFLVSWGTTSGQYTHSQNVDASELSTEVTGLLHGAEYFIIVQAVSERGTKSEPSSEIAITAQDGTPPASIIDLVATSFEGAIQEASRSKTTLRH